MTAGGSAAHDEMFWVNAVRVRMRDNEIQGGVAIVDLRGKPCVSAQAIVHTREGVTMLYEVLHIVPILVAQHPCAAMQPKNQGTRTRSRILRKIEVKGLSQVRIGDVGNVLFDKRVPVGGRIACFLEAIRNAARNDRQK